MMDLKKDYRIEGKRLWYCMPGEVDHHSAKEVAGKIDMLIDSYQIRDLIMDFQNTEFMDSSGIGVIIGRCRKMQFTKGTVTAVHVGNRVDTILRSAGLYKIMQKAQEQEGV